MAAQIGDRIRITRLPSNVNQFAIGDFAVIEDIYPTHVSANFAQPENKKVVGVGLWAVDRSWFEVIGHAQTVPQRIGELERQIGVLTEVARVLAANCVSGAKQVAEFDALLRSMTQ